MRMTIRHLTALSTTLALSVSLAAQTTQSAPTPAVTASRSTSTPYRGDLSIFEEKGRESRLQIDRVMDILHITSGKTVADVGAGGGWFTVRAAKRVGAEGRVFGEDINADAARAIGKRAEKEHLPQITPVLGTPDDAKLPGKSVDAVLLLKVYHEIAAPIPFMRSLRAALRPEARVGIIDRNGNGGDHGLKQSVLEQEMSEAGYREVEHYDFTKADGQDYFLVFVAKL